MENINNDYLKSQINTFEMFLSNVGVDLNKVRYSTLPNFEYDYKNDIVNPITGLFNGNLVESGTTIKLSADSVEVDETNLANMINNTELGFVFYLTELSRPYSNGEWPLRLRMVNLDEKISILNDYDDMWEISSDESLESKIESIKLYYEENISSLIFLTINPDLIGFIESEVGYNSQNRTFAGLPIKINTNMKIDIISLSTYDESFYLKINE